LYNFIFYAIPESALDSLKVIVGFNRFRKVANAQVMARAEKYCIEEMVGRKPSFPERTRSGGHSEVERSLATQWPV
jgi:hypothetical protein